MTSTGRGGRDSIAAISDMRGRCRRNRLVDMVTLRRPHLYFKCAAAAFVIQLRGGQWRVLFKPAPDQVGAAVKLGDDLLVGGWRDAF